VPGRDVVYYKNNYKYVLDEDFAIHTATYGINIKLPENKDIVTEFIVFRVDGILIIKKGFLWDGPSGPTVDTDSFMRGALVHDALYRLMRCGFIDYKKHRRAVDDLMKAICKADGMNWFRRWYVHRAVSFHQHKRR